MAGDVLENRNLYEILGVDRNDPSGAVHEAFVKLVPKYPPNKDLDGFRALQTAYHTLMDPRAREEYDNLMACGPDVASLMNSAFSSMALGRFRRAELLFKKIVDETGGSSEALKLLGMAQAEQGHFHDSIQTLTGLIERFPNVPLYRIVLGNMLMARLESLEGEDAKAHAIKRAREQYEKAIELDAGNIAPYIEISRTYLRENDPVRAFEWIEKSTGRKGRGAFGDFEALIFGYVVLAYQPDLKKLTEQADKIESSIPEDVEARAFASTQIVYASLGLLHDRKIEAARELVVLASKVSPNPKEFRTMLRAFSDAVNAEKEWDCFKSDAEIITPIKDMASSLFEYVILRPNVDRFENATREFFEKLDEIELRDVVVSLERMKKIYPYTWKINRDFWNHMLKLGHGFVGQTRAGNIRFSWILAVFILLQLIVLLTRAMGCN